MDLKGLGADDVPYPVTLHDVYAQDGVTVKTGNPYRNNAWEEFYRALHARYLGIVEAKAPIGFSFHTDDLYGVEKPGKMFYKHLEGQSLEAVIKVEDDEFLHWALWETGKFFSRLINANLYLEDPHRLGNYFIENSPIANVFRFLDLERVRYVRAYSNEMKIKMLEEFIKAACEEGFIASPKSLCEFVMICVGARMSSADLIKRFLSQPSIKL
ncbi:MAG: hypothetical protein ABIA67_01705 [Candidatus Margulisiibacteriota bacterium]